jgi:hypothetical protein
MSPNAGGGDGDAGSLPANKYSCTHGAQTNFGDLTPYLTYAFEYRTLFSLAGLCSSGQGQTYQRTLRAIFLAWLGLCGSYRRQTYQRKLIIIFLAWLGVVQLTGGQFLSRVLDIRGRYYYDRTVEFCNTTFQVRTYSGL